MGKDLPNNSRSGKLELWMLAPPLIALLLLGGIRLAGIENQLFLKLNHAAEFAPNLVWISLTVLGDGLAASVLVLPFIRRQPRFAWTMIVAWILVAVWTKITKDLVGAPRPLSVFAASQVHVIGLHYKFHSLPSGHAAMIAALAASVCLYYKKRWLQALLIVLALLVGLSRIAIGIHWPTDVLVGFAGGWLLAIAAYYLSGRFTFGLSVAARLIYGTILLGGAIWMLLASYSDYPEAFRIQQALAAICIGVTFTDLLWFYYLSRSAGSSRHAAFDLR